MIIARILFTIIVLFNSVANARIYDDSDELSLTTDRLRWGYIYMF